jgi:hypothetical protein
MSTTKIHIIDVLALAITASLFVLSTGCSKAGPKTYPVKGRIDVAASDLKALAGHTVELALESDPQIRAAGQINDDGSFAVETLYGGRVLPGATEGTYRARIVLADDDIASKKLAARSLHPRYFQFDKSGLAIQVPAAEVVSLRVTRR